MALPMCMISLSICSTASQACKQGTLAVETAIVVPMTKVTIWVDISHDSHKVDFEFRNKNTEDQTFAVASTRLSWQVG